MAKDVDENLKHKIEFIISSNETLAEKKIKTRLNIYCPNISMETIRTRTWKTAKQMNHVNLFIDKLSHR